MKTNILPATLASLGFAILPLHAEDGANDKPVPAVADQATQKTISTYVILVSGRG